MSHDKRSTKPQEKVATGKGEPVGERAGSFHSVPTDVKSFLNLVSSLAEAEIRFFRFAQGHEALVFPSLDTPALAVTEITKETN